MNEQLKAAYEDMAAAVATMLAETTPGAAPVDHQVILAEKLDAVDAALAAVA